MECELWRCGDSSSGEAPVTPVLAPQKRFPTSYVQDALQRVFLLACALGGLARPFARSPVPPDRPETRKNHSKSAGSPGPSSPVRPSLRPRQSCSPKSDRLVFKPVGLVEHRRVRCISAPKADISARSRIFWCLVGFGKFWADVGRLLAGFGWCLAGFGPESKISVPRGGYSSVG